MLSPSKTSLTMSEDCEEMQRSEKTEESLALEGKAKAASFDEICKAMLSDLAEMENRTNRWPEYEHERELVEDPLVEQSYQAVVNENWHKFHMTEGEKAEVVGRLISEACEGKAKAASPDFIPSLAVQDTVSKVNLWTSLAFISATIFLDREYYKDINSVYKLFDAFMICIILSFTGAFCALLIRNKPKLAVLRGCYFLLSIVSMASALSIMGYALFLESFGWVY